jgi:hypothetical protein
MRDPDSSGFEEFQRDLLGQHNVSDRDSPFGHEAQQADAPALLIELLDVHLVTTANAITRPRDAAGHLKIRASFKLRSLGGGQIADK